MTKQILQASLGTEAFLAAFEQVKALSVADAIALAKGFAGLRTTSKVKALRAIWARHQNVLTAQAKRRATAGRIAA